MRRGVLCLLAAALVATAACGGDGDDSAERADRSEESTVGDGTGDVSLPTSSASASDYAEGTILRALHDDGRFGVFVALVEQLGDTFTRFFQHANWPNTLLAPTDAAFEALDDDVLATLLADESLLLTVMRYHILGDGPVPVDELGGRYYTPAGPVVVEQRDGVAVIAGVEIHATGIEVGGANEGVIHLMEKVILPCESPVVEQALDTCTG